MHLVVPGDVARVYARPTRRQFVAAIHSPRSGNEDADSRKKNERGTDSRADAASKSVRQREAECKGADAERKKANDHDPAVLSIEGCERTDLLASRAVLVLHLPSN